MASQAPSAHPVPWIYRLIFHYVEPFLATGGVLQLLLAPKAYLEIATPSLSAKLDQTESMPTDAMGTLYTQIVGGWCMIVFNDLVTLRFFERDVRIWRCILASHLISDLLYSWAIFQDWGDKAWAYQTWDGLTWFTVVTTVGPMLLKVAFLFGIGIGINCDRDDRVKVGSKQL